MCALKINNIKYINATCKIKNCNKKCSWLFIEAHIPYHCNDIADFMLLKNYGNNIGILLTLITNIATLYATLPLSKFS